ncbi:hypothetical protein [Pseudomonas sp. GV071]|uniref:hypothetical protein n=1 Tax=Pseudomonas sp. GV071 TaxID=2135754 RepID=UPI000D391CC8|nr:hypothetical protein [Pseudomonas sp. GV071]PTQ70495.1 hypothetical protein C8K61_106221 [Pseudomonas sp. GV071]
MEIGEFKHLWDGSESGWALKKLIQDSWRLVFYFSSEGPNARQITLLRQFIPELMSSPLSKVHNQLKGKPCYRTREDYGSSDGYRLRRQAEALGLKVSSEVASNVSYMPVRNELVVTIIEDQALARAVVLRMIEAGVPVLETYVD